MKTRYKDVNNKESEGDTAAIEINANMCSGYWRQSPPGITNMQSTTRGRNNQLTHTHTLNLISHIVVNILQSCLHKHHSSIITYVSRYCSAYK